jgi:hypothetical protein
MNALLERSLHVPPSCKDKYSNVNNDTILMYSLKATAGSCEHDNEPLCS